MDNSKPTKNDMFDQLMINSPMYVFFKDDKGRAIQLSSNYEKMLGKPIQELLGKTMDDLFPSDLAKSMIADDLRTLQEGKPVTIEEELNGRLCTTTKFPVIIKGKPSYLAGYTIDITEHKHAEDALRKSEERFRKMFVNHGAIMLLIEPESGLILDANQAAIRFYEYEKNKLCSMNINEINAFSTKKVAEGIHKVLHCNENHFIFTHRLANGKERNVGSPWSQINKIAPLIKKNNYFC